MPDQVFADPAGDDSGPGTFERPLRSVAHAVSRLDPGGGTVYLLAGVYWQDIELTDVGGIEGDPIVIQSWPGQEAVIAAADSRFHSPASDDEWVLVDDVLAEYASAHPIDEPDPLHHHVRGAFYDRQPYTRLVSYDRFEDFRSTNELFPKVFPGDPAFNDPSLNLTARGYKRPWVYMGPGVILDDRGHVHIRLSHTHNGVEGFRDYEGPTDPNDVRLAISPLSQTPVLLRRCDHVVFHDVTIRFGGESTIVVSGCTDVVFDHVRIDSASRAVALRGDEESGRGTVGVTLSNCTIDGGTPPWFFRSDRKDDYTIVDGPYTGIHDNLGYSTTGVCLSGEPSATHSGFTVHHCEITNVHDIYVFGDYPHFHHNRFHNINDDVLAFVQGTRYASVEHNVITKSLTAFSFADGTPTGQVYIYRNLIDLRLPTAGVRPAKHDQPRQSLRRGQFFKMGGGAAGRPEGPIDLFHNTCLVLAPGTTGDFNAADPSEDLGNAFAFTHFVENTDQDGRRTSYNNIFVGVHLVHGTVKPIVRFPDPDFAGPTDGNLYFQLEPQGDPASFRIREWPPRVPVGRTFVNLDLYRQSDHFKASPSPGFESHGLDVNPGFESLGSDGTSRPTDDFRLTHHSPARSAGAFLPFRLKLLEDHTPGPDTEFSRPDIGCYPKDNSVLRVGVDGRIAYPASLT